MVANTSASFFDPSNSGNRNALLPMQVGVVQGPTPSTLQSGTGLLLPDQELSARLNNFPVELYNLADSSHLVRFMQALIGDTGAGQLRKRQLISRLTDALTSTHFFDLDKFYGAIFGATRENDSLFAADPMISVATPDDWDTIMAADAKFRESILALAKAISMGASPAGLTAAAEAVLGAPVAIYEDWQLLDPLGRNDVGSDTQSDGAGAQTWSQVIAAHSHWSNLNTLLWANLSFPGSVSTPASPTQTYWSSVATNFGPHYSNMNGIKWSVLQAITIPSPPSPVIPYGDRFGFQLVPLKKYDNQSDVVNLTTKSADIFQISRVLQRLKPAGSLMTVDPSGLEIVTQVTIANLAAASSFWEIDYTVAPKTKNTALYPVSAAQAAAGISPLDPHTPPRYAFQGSQATEWHYNSEVVSVVSYQMDENKNVVNNEDYQIVTFFDGSQVKYTADKGLMDPSQAWGAINAKATSASPYAGSR